MNRSNFIKTLVASLGLCSLILFSGLVFGTEGNEERAVTRIVKQFFEVINTRDLNLAEKLVFKKGYSISINLKKTGSPVSFRSFKDFLISLPKKESGVYKETMDHPKILVQKNIAVLWAEYKFYINNQYSHSGVDAFSLLKTGGNWQITHILYTIE